MDEGRAVDVSLSFSKALNLVSHSILRKRGLDGWAVRWIGKWLKSRPQRV